MATCPPLLVAPPPTTPYTGGLFAAARFPELPPDGNGNRWECGIQYEAETCAKPSGWHEVCPPEVPEVKVPTLTFPLVDGTPFTALLGVECKLVGTSLQELERRVINAFVACEQAAVESIYWTGSEGNTPSLAAPPGTPPAAQCQALGTVDDPFTIVGALAAIETFLGDNYCGTGVIHAPRTIAPYAASMNLICGCNAERPTTPLGTRWAFGGGYSVNTGPDGVEAPDGVAWLYVTGAVNIWRSEVWVNPDDLRYAFNTRTNDVTIFAERKYIVTHECVCAAIPVTVGCQC